MNNWRRWASGPIRVWWYAWTLAVLWTAAVGVILAWELYHDRQQALEIARGGAQAVLEKDLLFRRWNAMHGGVYVPVTDKTRPSPHLSHVPERDISTPSGRSLTLINPAYMMRQVHELGQEQFGLRGHLTSLKPIRPGNAPDPWEEQALLAFAQGRGEASSVQTLDGHPYLRLMRPLITERRCLKCHTQQGYTVGDVRGGISVSVQLATIWAMARTQMAHRTLGYAMLWGLGLTGILFGSRRLRCQIEQRRRAELDLGKARDRLELCVEQHTAELGEANARLKEEIAERKQAEEELQRTTNTLNSILASSTEYAIAATDLDFRITHYNPTAEQIFGYTAQDVIGRTVQEMHTRETVVPERFERAIESVIRDGKYEYEVESENPDGQKRFMHSVVMPMRDRAGECVGYVLFSHDITERKQNEEELARHRDHLEQLVGARTAELEKANRQLRQQVAQRQGAEQKARRQKVLLEGINRVFQEALTCKTEEEVAQACLAVAEELTGSKFGFIGELNEAGLLDTIAISNPGWDACKMPDSEATRLIQNMEIRGIDRSVLREKKSRIVNDPASHADRVGTPEGHPQVTAFLGVPLTRRGRTIGMIGLANKASGYQQTDLEVIEALSVAFVEALTGKRAEEEVRESEERYRRMTSAVTDYVFNVRVGQGEAVQTTHSPACVAVTGYTAEELAGDPDLWIRMVHEHDREAVREQTWRVLSGQSVEPLEHRIVRKDGVTRWVKNTPALQYDARGNLVSYDGLIRDITERKKAELELQRYTVALESANLALEEFNEAAQAATRAKSEFLANMSHEIRSPMTAILGFADTLVENVHDPSNVDAVNTIKRNGEYLLQIINDILDLSKIEAEKLQVERVACSPAEVMAEVASLMRVRAQAKGLPLKVEYAGPIPEHIQSDPVRLRQILINLVGNAIKFTELGSVRLVARLTPADEKPPRLQFDVIDTGIGMTPKQLARVFQPFMQADTSTSRQFGGTGLGLTISQRLAEMLGGDIAVNSSPGEGSAFSVTIDTGPLDGAPMLDRPTEAMVAGRPEVKPSAALKIELNCRILLVEDGPDNQRLISFLLKKAGADVTVAENGKIAVEKALSASAGWGRRHGDEKEPFDVILMDMQMPVMDGYQATRRLRRKGYQGPIIALTAHAMKEDRQKCLDAGCDDYLSKPIDREKLLETVEKHAQDPAQRSNRPADASDGDPASRPAAN